MATERSSTVTTPSGSLAKWASWLAALVGLWVLVSPFVLSGAFGSGTPMYSTAIGGVVVLGLSAFGAYSIRTGAETPPNSLGEIGGWLAALLGLWMAVSPFVLTGEIASGTPMWSNVVAGILAAVLAAYAGYELHTAG